MTACTWRDPRIEKTATVGATRAAQGNRNQSIEGCSKGAEQEGQG
jgi:hypothetical protein